MSPPCVLFVGSHFRGNEAFRHARDLGHTPLLLTEPPLLACGWDRGALEDVLAVPSLADRATVLGAVRGIARHREIERVVAIDDPAVDLAAELREDLQIPGLGVSAARRFRDKLAMRRRASAAGLEVPSFVHALNEAAVERFLADGSFPVLLKPRGEASSRGIVRLEGADHARAVLAELGDARAGYLLERFVRGPVHHVDSVVVDGTVLFAEVHRYRRPLLEVVNSGDIMITSTVPRAGAVESSLRKANVEVLRALGLDRGVAHTEFILAEDDSPVFLESAARVGGASIPSLVAATTGVDLWRAFTELELGGDWRAPATGSSSHGALFAGLSRAASPPRHLGDDAQGVTVFSDAPYEAAMVVRADSAAVLERCIATYEPRFRREVLGR